MSGGATASLRLIIFVVMAEKRKVKILKSTGEKVDFSLEKLKNGLSAAGANREQVKEIAEEVERKIYDGITTQQIYKLAYSLLRKKRSHKTAGRYRLKKAIFELGPSGFPFEIFVGKLFESFGYNVKMDVMMEGKCVQHEVDVVASKDNTLVIVESKFRSDYRGKTNVQVPLYIHSRFNDIKEKLKDDSKYANYTIRGFVVTNARFTTDAIKYAECAGLGLISWDYPSKSSLKYYIDRSGLHPVTSLHTLRKQEKQLLLEKGIVLCSQLSENKDLLEEAVMDDEKVKKVLDEAELIVRSDP